MPAWSNILSISLPPANEVCEVYVITLVCQSFCSQGRGLNLEVCIGGVCIQGDPVGSASGESTFRGSRSASRGVCIRGLGRPPTGYYWIRSTSGRYASYWNAFLFFTWIGLTFFRIRILSVWTSLTRASTSVNPTSHTVPHVPLTRISRRFPSTSLIQTVFSRSTADMRFTIIHWGTRTRPRQLVMWITV